MADYPPQEGHGVEGVQVDVPGVPGVVPKPVNNRRIGDARIEGDDIADGYPTKMLGICVASVWLIAAAAAPRNGYMSLDNGSGDLWDVDLDGPHTYCIVVGSVALTLCAIVLMLIKYKPEPLEKVICNIRGSPVKGEQFVAIFLVFWWAAAAAVGTFYSPFETNVGNGYFALWAGFGFSLSALGDCYETVRKQLTKSRSRLSKAGGFGSRDDLSIHAPAMGLFCACMVLLFACIKPLSDANEDDQDLWEAILGIVASIITIIMTLLFKCLDEQGCVVKLMVSVIACLWIITAGILTFRQPFTETSNGFFASYCALFFCFQLVAITFFEK